MLRRTAYPGLSFKVLEVQVQCWPTVMVQEEKQSTSVGKTLILVKAKNGSFFKIVKQFEMNFRKKVTWCSRWFSLGQSLYLWQLSPTCAWFSHECICLKRNSNESHFSRHCVDIAAAEQHCGGVGLCLSLVWFWKMQKWEGCQILEGRARPNFWRSRPTSSGATSAVERDNGWCWSSSYSWDQRVIRAI